MLTIEYFFPLLCWGISVSMTTSGFCRLANSPKANPGEQVLAQAFRFARDSPALVSGRGSGPGAAGRPRERGHELCAISVSSQGCRLQVEMKLPGFQFEGKFIIRQDSSSHALSSSQSFVSLWHFEKVFHINSESPHCLVTSRLFHPSCLISCGNDWHSLPLDTKKQKNRVSLNN